MIEELEIIDAHMHIFTKNLQTALIKESKKEVPNTRKHFIFGPTGFKVNITVSSPNKTSILRLKLLKTGLLSLINIR